LTAFKNIESKIKSLEQAMLTISEWKEKETIVFTNGCFDLLHMGHIDYLSKAKDLGSKLVIGLNSSESVKRLKGPSRPINSDESRSILLAALEFVDLVILFGEETPINLISNILPNVLAKGGDYNYHTIIGAKKVTDYGGKVEAIPFLDGYSTTNIVAKIQSFSKS
jgi:rfaE bifunctional protein nucleotidyltransferase chain/domain